MSCTGARLARPELVVLDLAGTTVVDAGEVPEAFRSALAEEGIALDSAAIGRLRGASKREAIAGLFAGEEVDSARAERAYERFRARLSGIYAVRGVRAIDGAEAAIGALRAQGIRVALNTGFDREITALLLGMLGWGVTGPRLVVDAVVCGDDVARGRPAPDLIEAAIRATGVADPSRVANVGDTTRDLEAAAAAGCGWSFGVLSGAHGRAALERVPHTHLIESVAALPGLFVAG